MGFARLQLLLTPAQRVVQLDLRLQPCFDEAQQPNALCVVKKDGQADASTEADGRSWQPTGIVRNGYQLRRMEVVGLDDDVLHIP